VKRDRNRDHDQLLALAGELAATRQTLKSYARRKGVSASTLHSQALRAGLLIGVEVRQRRVAAVIAEAARSGRPTSTVALDQGWSSPQAFYRARRSLRQRWGRVL